VTQYKDFKKSQRHC